MAKQETLLQKLEKGARQRKLKKFSDKSYKWFRNKVRTIGGERARTTLLKDAQNRNMTRNIPVTGYMYSFIYDAKYKDKLPYWDAFPLILLVGRASGGFYGVNLHYLPPKPRAVFFDELLKITNNKSYTKRTKFQLSYNLLSSSGKFKMFRPAFKRYLYSHMKSKLALIPAGEWESALFLPTADFQKANNSKVWSDSILKSR